MSDAPTDAPTDTPKANIGPDGVRFRAFFAGLFFLFTLMMWALLTVSDAPFVLRMTLFLPAWLFALCLFQAVDGTCVFLAARGACSTEMGTRPLEDRAVRDLFGRRAARVHLKALFLALFMTVGLVLLSAFVSWRLPAG